MKIRLAVALRMFAGASYIDVALLFGIAKESVFHITWQVVDAINNTPTVGPFFFPQTREECTRQAKEWEVGARVFVVNHQVWCPAESSEGLSGVSSAFLHLAKKHRSEGVGAFVVQKRVYVTEWAPVCWIRNHLRFFPPTPILCKTRTTARTTAGYCCRESRLSCCRCFSPSPELDMTHTGPNILRTRDPSHP